MRQYLTISSAVFSQRDIFNEIINTLQHTTVSRCIDGVNVYLEECYLSKELFKKLTRNGTSLSATEHLWFPTSASPLYRMVFTKVNEKEVTYYKVSVISEGAQLTVFSSASKIKYILLLDSENTVPTN